MRRLRESESRVNFFTKGAGHTANNERNELKDNKMNIEPQNRLINYVKNKFKNIIDGILNRYDNYVYYNEYKRIFKDNRSNYQKLKDKVNLAIACLNKNISKYNISGTIDGHPHRLFIDSLLKGQLRRTKGNSKK